MPGEAMSQRQEELMQAAQTREPHGAAFGMAEKVIKDAAEAKEVGSTESALNLNVAKEKVKKSGSGEGFADAAIRVLNKMEGWFTKRHAANESNAAGRIAKATEQRQTIHKLAEEKAAKFAKQETFEAAKAQFNELSPKGAILSIPEIPNIVKEIQLSYHEWRVKANESKAEIYGTKAKRYGEFASQLRDVANKLKEKSTEITTATHTAAEKAQATAQKAVAEASTNLQDRMAELKRVKDSNYLQSNATGETSRISANPDQADTIQADSRKAWAEQIAPANANSAGTK